MLKLRWIGLALTLVVALSTGCSVCLLSPPPPRSYTVDLADVDGDGDVDAVVGNGPGNIEYAGESNAVWLNDGAGHFTDSGQRLIGSGGTIWSITYAVALGDLNGDGDIDAVFGNAVPSPNTVWVNDGAGQFKLYSEHWMKAEGDYSHSKSEAMQLGDLDGDGDLDLFVANCCRSEWAVYDSSNTPVQHGYSDAHNMVWLNDGSGRFADSGQRLGNEATGDVALGDLDGDGDLDAFEVNHETASTVSICDAADRVWLNDGAGYFVDSGQILSRAHGDAVALGDLDGDGDLDAFVGNGRTVNPDEVWFNDGSGHFTDSGQRLGNDNTRTIVLDDVDGDGNLDAFVASDDGGRIWVNDGTGHFTDSRERFNWSRHYAANLADVNGDGDKDVFAIHFNGDCLIWQNDGAGHFARRRDGAIPPACLAAGSSMLLGAVLVGWWINKSRSGGSLPSGVG